MEAVDPYNIFSNISNLSLGIEPGEVKVLCEVWESDFIEGQSNVECPPIPSFQSMCNHLVDKNMTCPTYHSRLKDKGRHVIVSHGCKSYPFPYSRSTWPLNGENSNNHEKKLGCISPRSEEVNMHVTNMICVYRYR